MSSDTAQSFYRLDRRRRTLAGIIELLQRRGLQKISRVKIVRHKDKRYPLNMHSLREVILSRSYQAYQVRRRL